MIEKKPKNVTANKIVFSLVLFVGIGFLFNTVLTYIQTSTTQTTLESRAVVGDENLRLNRVQTEQIEQLREQLNRIELKLENSEKTGNTTN